MPLTRRTRSSGVSAEETEKGGEGGGVGANSEAHLFRGGIDSPASEGGNQEAMQVETDLGLASDDAPYTSLSNQDRQGDTEMADATALKIAEQKTENVPRPLADDGVAIEVGLLEDDEETAVPKGKTRSAVDDRDRLIEEPTSELLASLPVYLSTALPSSSSLQIFQYPTYAKRRPLPIPQNARERGLEPAMRIRAQAKRVEMELPLDLRPIVYNDEKGQEYGRGAAVSGAIGPGANTLPERRVKSEFGIGSGASSSAHTSKRRLEKTRLEGSLLPHQTNYMIGIVRDKALHLTPVDSVHQLRPSMHYLDALEAIERQQSKHGNKEDGDDDEDGDILSGDEQQSGGVNGRSRGSTTSTTAAAAPPPKRRPQSVNVSIRSDPNDLQGSGGGGSGSGGGTGRLGSKAGAGSGAAAGLDTRDLLMLAEREAQSERWVDLDWKDERTDEARKAFDSQMFAVQRTPLQCTTRPSEFLKHL